MMQIDRFEIKENIDTYEIYDRKNKRTIVETKLIFKDNSKELAEKLMPVVDEYIQELESRE